MHWWMMLGGVLSIVGGVFSTKYYLELMNAGTGKIKGRRGRQINKKPDYKKIEFFKKLQLILYSLGTVAIAYGVMKWANSLNFWE
ncbi:hypothetical protein ACFL54_09070 [Planctomycetota bacterium]